MPEIKGYHAHVYFGADTVETARTVCEEAARLFPAVTMGRMHERNVGPHPRWSCQLGFGADALDQVLPWLMLNRQGLTIFTHPDTGEHLEDHRDRAVWMGELLELDLSIFD
ncbi:DOPA 4,5-dioxygenase family protein [Tropicibacter sp. R16_0]|uniref:DOPA 4,5-dioxygenase family protein n=1 Tax=Tropicibacter sp. R16_0 TaxID=2821102 RepID=UPI001AD9C3FB|nr:DOPA 4,5-dioxygenase family protein [Tropicibacter sp. R16_0]MBO9452580.1 DOPA 4,5-dioxygenase family protein [Tropicibacter sp. R16_0]